MKLNQSGVTVLKEEDDGDDGGEDEFSSSSMSSKRKWDPFGGGGGVPALCRFYFLIPNLHQPPHNNMADPACGTGATQLETRIRPVQLV